MMPRLEIYKLPMSTLLTHNTTQHNTTYVTTYAMTEPKKHRWSRDNHLISTDKSLLSASSINAAFSQDWVYWTQAYPEAILQEIINNSLCLGLYKTSETHDPNAPEQIGFARLITDSTTFAYFTDLYVLPEHQGQGLGSWLIDCVGEVVSSMPHLRWAMLRTSGVKSKETYERRLGMGVLAQNDAAKGVVMMGRKGSGGV